MSAVNVSEIKPAVAVHNLVKRFGNFTAVDNITFDVPKGEVFGFLGSNGSGKSTTIRMLCGLLLPTSGAGSVAGFDILRQSDSIKARIGYMSQKFSLYEDLTVVENIEFYGEIYGVTGARLRERKEWVLEMANLSERAYSMTGELAVGWKQRLALGCAMVHEPEILFLDEPTGGVDPASRRNFWELIYSAAGQGVTVFVTTHYMDEAEHCDRLGLIDAGRLVAIGSPQELKEQYVAGVLLEVVAEPIMTAFDALMAIPFAREVTIFGAALHIVVDGLEVIPQVKEALEIANVSVKRIEPIAPSLEDVFVAHIERGRVQGDQ